MPEVGVNKIVIDESGEIKSVVVGIQGPQGPRGFQGIDLDDSEAMFTPETGSQGGIQDASLIYCSRMADSNNPPGFKADSVITIKEIVNGGIY